MRRWVWRCVGAVATGVLLALAFPSPGHAEAAWVALVPFLFICHSSTPRQSFRWGFVAGLVFWMLTLTWLLKLRDTFGVTSLALLGWLALSAYCAVYFGLFGLVAAKLLRVFRGAGTDSDPDLEHPYRNVPGNLLAMLLLAILWTGLEYLRSTLFTGFSWNGLGISQYRRTVLIQLAAFGGVYAVSAVVMFVNAALFFTVLEMTRVWRRQTRNRVHVELMAGLLVVVLCWTYGALEVRKMVSARVRSDRHVRIASVQPNVPQVQKWSREFVQSIFDALVLQTDMAVRGAPQLVLWPETAVPGYLGVDAACAQFVGGLARDRVPILTGIMEVDVGGRAPPDAPAADVETWYKVNARFFNSAVLFDRQGAAGDRYRKQHLVPFGEYLPFDRTFEFLRKMALVGYSCSPGTTSTVFRVNVVFERWPGRFSEAPPPAEATSHGTLPFSVLICFEDTMADLSRESVRQGARLLVNITNDAWFDGTAGPVQHLSQCVFRSVENRVTVVRCANSGVTCFIDRSGLIDDETQMTLARNDIRSVLYRLDTAWIAEENMASTFYTRWGDRPFALPCGILALVGVVSVAWLERRNRMGESLS